ncbi:MULTISPECIES: trypsin-like serine protease [unclassified Streptomyces]|uniref:trypsin-like serine protease n=1 Tax=unclassified Streptomyces TaxID=2593676 RepID=UPI00278C808E|nr:MULTISPECIES: trypsin-like serine protease [unclassified Streptomyces]
MHSLRSSRRLRPAALVVASAAGSLALSALPAAALTGTPVSDADTTYAYTAQVIVGDHDRGCSAALVDAEWLLTAASCFAADPAASLDVPAGAPKKPTTAVIGRADLSGSQGAERRVVELVPRTDRDVVLARLNRPVTNVTPIALATSAAAAGAELTFTGYGRTKTEWAPLKLHTGTYTVNSTATTSADVTGKDAAACMGDAGGPVVAAGKLVGLGSRSSQGGCYGIDETQTSTAGVISRVDGLASWVKSETDATAITDFNGDGVEDIAIADAKASVAGGAGAGLVRLVYGGGKGTAQIDQELDWVAGGAEAGDGFGSAIDTVDHNEDGYTDLVVGTPGEDLDGKADTGMVDVLYGAAGGLGTGSVKAEHFEQGTGTGAIKEAVGEAGDRMGQALAAGTTRAGRPWLVIGSPGEDVGDAKDAGSAFYVYDNTSKALHQDLPTDVPGVAETDDRFGSAISGDRNYFAIGAPGETVGSAADSGTVALFSHTLDADGRPDSIGGMDQSNDAVTGAAEADDEFGAALAMTAYRTSSTATADASMLAIGSPGETSDVDGSDRVGAGRVVLVQIDAKGAWSYVRELRQGDGTDTVVGTSETGDRMGESLTAINTAPRQVATAATLKVAVGTPGEAVGSATKAGAIHTFSLLGAAGDNDLWIEAGDGDGIPGTPTANHRLGQSIHYTGTKLYAGLPYGPVATGVLYALPIGNTYPGGTSGTVTTYKPGTGGLPAAGTEFGSAAR